jgi:hypothetical protein
MAAAHPDGPAPTTTTRFVTHCRLGVLGLGHRGWLFVGFSAHVTSLDGLTPQGEGRRYATE